MCRIERECSRIRDEGDGRSVQSDDGADSHDPTRHDDSGPARPDGSDDPRAAGASDAHAAGTARSARTACSARTDDVGSDVHSHVVPDDASPYAVPYKP